MVVVVVVMVVVVPVKVMMIRRRGTTGARHTRTPRTHAPVERLHVEGVDDRGLVGEDSVGDNHGVVAALDDSLALARARVGGAVASSPNFRCRGNLRPERLHQAWAALKLATAVAAVKLQALFPLRLPMLVPRILRRRGAR